jgi:hypothetical protein
MPRSRRALVALPLALAAAGALTTLPAVSADAATPASHAATAGSSAVFLAADLVGRNELPPAPGGPATGDADGHAFEVVKIEGNTVSYAIRWSKIAAPTAAHIHAGARGSNGGVAVGFFGGALPDGTSGASGSVTVADNVLLDALKSNASDFYANIHTSEFPGGAVRGQFHKLNHGVNLDRFLRGGPIAAAYTGAQEVPVPGKPAVGDPDGTGTGTFRAGKQGLSYAISWSGIGQPTGAHIHQGAAGTNGGVVVDLFEIPAGVPTNVTGLAGRVSTVDPSLIKQIHDSPAGFYSNLHNAEFPGGAVRGQLSASHTPLPAAFIAPVVKGANFYQCQSANGTTSFIRTGVKANLQDGISHVVSSVNGSLVPRWTARDGSQVTGSVVSSSDNGADNLPELDLNATSTGAAHGELARVVEILRLNTVGGVAPAGTCTAGRKLTVPYQATYFFVSK